MVMRIRGRCLAHRSKTRLALSKLLPANSSSVNAHHRATTSRPCSNCDGPRAMARRFPRPSRSLRGAHQNEMFPYDRLFEFEAAPQQFFKHLRRRWQEMPWVQRFNFRIALGRAAIFLPEDRASVAMPLILARLGNT
jgi:hypothetical protein